MRGSGFYQLTKSEKVQEYKGIVIQKLSTNELFGGKGGSLGDKEVRTLLNLPVGGGTVRVHPAINPEYRIYIQSTSDNRNLMPNTTLLLNKKAL